MGSDSIKGFAMFSWNLAMFLPSILQRGLVLGITGIVDLALAFALGVGVVIQGSFISQTCASCPVTFSNDEFFDSVSPGFATPRPVGHYDLKVTCGGMVSNLRLSIAAV